MTDPFIGPAASSNGSRGAAARRDSSLEKQHMALTKAQRKHLEGRLQEERERLRRDLNRSMALREENDAQDRLGDPLGADTINSELDASNETRMARELDEIDAALERLYQTPERFGICEETGRPIPYERLEIVPWARTCDQAGA